MNDMSGSFVFRSGVGTQMLMVSSAATAPKSVVARSRPAGDELRDLGGRHVGDVRRARVDRVDLPRVEVDADGVEAGARELDGERQTDVAEADDADAGAVRVNPIEQFDQRQVTSETWVLYSSSRCGTWSAERSAAERAAHQLGAGGIVHAASDSART